MLLEVGELIFCVVRTSLFPMHKFPFRSGFALTNKISYRFIASNQTRYKARSRLPGYRIAKMMKIAKDFLNKKNKILLQKIEAHVLVLSYCPIRNHFPHCFEQELNQQTFWRTLFFILGTSVYLNFCPSYTSVLREPLE